jgi:hypothetical protein
VQPLIAAAASSSDNNKAIMAIFLGIFFGIITTTPKNGSHLTKSHCANLRARLSTKLWQTVYNL